jgi:hypothetical protein
MELCGLLVAINKASWEYLLILHVRLDPEQHGVQLLPHLKLPTPRKQMAACGPGEIREPMDERVMECQQGLHRPPFVQAL